MWWWLACSSPAPDPSAGWSGGTTAAPDPVPARFAAPPSLARGPDDRPFEALRAAVCHDRPGVRDALRAAIAATPGRDRAAWGTVTGEVDCDDPSFCPWVRASLAAAGPEERDVWLVGLWSCRDADSVATLLADAPPGVATAYLAQSVRDEPLGLPWLERYADLARAALAEPDVPEAVFRGLAALPDPRGRALVRTLAEGESGARRDVLLAALDGSLDAGEALLAEEACHRLGRLGCVGRTAVTDLGQAVARGLDPRGLPARWPHLGAALRDGLAGCIVGAGDAIDAHRCAEALAPVDGPAAAAAIAASPFGDALRDVIVDPGAARTALAACGVEVPEGAAAATSLGLLEAAGRATVVRAVSIDDDGTGLAYRLAHLAGLDDAEFGVLAPVAEEGDRALFGWRGRVRRRLVSPVRSGWDVVGATQLVNALLADAGRAERVVPEPGYVAWVVGDPTTLGCLAEAGLARFAEPPPPEEDP